MKPAPTLRILDANANRAREALRVMEEAARFALNDPALSSELKQLRHDLADCLGILPAPALHRDTPGDVGAAITTPRESQRTGLADVAVAAAKRLSEALRACEEFGKIIDPTFAARIKSLRYRGYDLESRLLARLGSPHRRQFHLCVLITEAQCEHHAWFDVARFALDGGADCLQLREKHLDDADLLDRAGRLAELIGSRTGPRRPSARRTARPPESPVFILNDRPDIARLSGADGVHLGTADLPVDAVRQLVGPDLLIGASTHNLRQAARAVRAGADYCGVGSMFCSTTKTRRPAGPAYLEKFCRRYPDIPHLAIGGITPDNVHLVRQAGARGIAVCACVCRAKRPATIVRKLLRA